MDTSITRLEKSLEKVDHNIKDDFQRNREESNKIAGDNRSEITKSLESFEKKFEERVEKMRQTVEGKLKDMQLDNSQQLEKMRKTVDEKLDETLEKRLGESFKLVSERLEKVHAGLGEMQKLATGVGDLKKVLTNVKTKGIIGEYQLENILEQILSPIQFEKNVKTKHNSNAHVEFAIKIPSKSDDNSWIWLPVDAKFPEEDYLMLFDAYEVGDKELIEKAQKEFANKIKIFAKDISTKYIDPPNTTDFAILFLPVESLYAEAIRNVGLFELLQRDYKIVLTGPTTITAFLSSLQMGFRTLAIEKRSSEVWEILGAVKTEFGKFGDILAKTTKKLDEARNVVESAGVRTRAIERKLRTVEEIPAEKASDMLTDTIDDNEKEENEQ
jgi:DNA recombination protein RmuC